MLIKPNSNTITYNNGNKVSNKLLIKTLKRLNLISLIVMIRLTGVVF